ncbi:unnamed protein product [Moneuplotes crassus]|uniref:Uncharacterized protein n=1 Tax=Euplotes crassus TaxID=5936 RepID=A0AAD1X5S1_EUPCR|nr:unnamed protein product [Moneuplotes crassus]
MAKLINRRAFGPNSGSSSSKNNTWSSIKESLVDKESKVDNKYFLNKLRLELTRKSMIRSGKDGYMNFNDSPFSPVQAKISNSTLGDNEFINSLNYLQLIRNCKKRIKHRLAKLGPSRKHVLNLQQDFKGYIYDKFIAPIKMKHLSLEANAYLVLMNDRGYYKELCKLNVHNKKSMRKNKRLRSSIKPEDLQAVFYRNPKAVDKEKNQLKEFKKVLHDKAYKEKLLKEGESNPFLPNFSQFKTETNSHSSSISHPVGVGLMHTKSFNSEVPRFSQSIKVQDDRKETKYSNLPMQSIVETNIKKKKRSKKQETLKERHFKSVDENKKKPIYPSVFFVVSKSSKSPVVNRFNLRKKSIAIKKVVLTDVFKSMMAKKDKFKAINSLKIDTKSLKSPLGLYSPKVTQYTADGVPKKLLSPSTVIKHKRKIRSPDQGHRIRGIEERCFTTKQNKRARRAKNITTLSKNSDILNLDIKDVQTQFAAKIRKSLIDASL